MAFEQTAEVAFCWDWPAATVKLGTIETRRTTAASTPITMGKTVLDPTAATTAAAAAFVAATTTLVTVWVAA